MQVARNFYLSTEKTFTRKIYEILLALKIESCCPAGSSRIYMNQIFLGHRAYGFAGGQRDLFRQAARQDISIAEAAMLASLPRRHPPTTRSTTPARHRAAAVSSTGCWTHGFITEEQHDAAKAEVLRPAR